MLLPCRSCIGCRLEKSRQTAVRLVHELKYHSHSGFLTLTYDDESLPVGGTLEPARWTKFAKDLRARFDFLELGRLKFFGVGEYGDQRKRPHYHAIVYSPVSLFGEEVEKSRSGERQWTCEHVSAVWPEGRHRISEVTFESAAYVARYLLKKQSGDAAESHYESVDSRTGEVVVRAKEFARWPKGLAKLHFEQWKADIYPSDEVVLPGRGKFLPPPYYDRLLEKEDPEFAQQIKVARQEKAGIHITEAEWFGLVNEKHRTGNVQKVRQAQVCPRGID